MGLSKILIEAHSISNNRNAGLKSKLDASIFRLGKRISDLRSLISSKVSTNKRLTKLETILNFAEKNVGKVAKNMEGKGFDSPKPEDILLSVGILSEIRKEVAQGFKMADKFLNSKENDDAFKTKLTTYLTDYKNELDTSTKGVQVSVRAKGI